LPLFCEGSKIEPLITLKTITMGFEKPSTGLNLTPEEKAFMDKEHAAKEKAASMKADNGKSWEEVQKELDEKADEKKDEGHGMDMAA
jgi:hypothetical protein